MHEYVRQHPGARLVDPETNVPDVAEAGHWDPAVAKRAGMPYGYDFGGQRVSWMAHLVVDWMGDDAFLKTLEVQERRPNILGDTTWLTGKVIRKYERGGPPCVDCQLWGDNQRHERTTLGWATVILPSLSLGLVPESAFTEAF